MFHPPNDVKIYIDGFNLYFAMKEQGWRKYYWLDVSKLAVKLIQKSKSLGFIDHGCQIDSVRYYTSRISDISKDGGKSARQTSYLEALESNNNLVNGTLTMSFGQYQYKPHTCNHCKRDIKLPIEKMTDVNLATDLLTDAFFENYRTAIVVSADSDLIAPVKSVRDLFADKRVIVAMPPGRWSHELAGASSNYFGIEERQLRQSQLPIALKRFDGFEIKRPVLWK